jgi:hypothetical protein
LGFFAFVMLTTSSKVIGFAGAVETFGAAGALGSGAFACA